MDTQGTSKTEDEYVGNFKCCACHEYRDVDSVRIIPRAEPFLSLFLNDLTAGYDFLEWVKETVKTLHRNEQLAVCTAHLRPGNAKDRLKIKGTTQTYAIRCPKFKAVEQCRRTPTSSYHARDHFQSNHHGLANRTVRLRDMMKPAPRPMPSLPRPNLLPVKTLSSSNIASANSRTRKFPGLYDKKPQLPPVVKAPPKITAAPIYVNVEPTPFYSPLRITEYTIPTSVLDNRLTSIIHRICDRGDDLEKQQLFEAVVAMLYDKSGITTEEFANEFQVDPELLSSVALEVVSYFESEKPGAKIDQREYAPPALYVPLKTKEDWSDLYNFIFENINEKNFVFKLGLYDKIRIANGCLESVLCGTKPQVAHKKYLIQYDRSVFTQFISQLTNSKNLQPVFLQCVTSRGYLFAPNKGIVKEAKVVVDNNTENQDVKYCEDTIRMISFEVVLKAIHNYGDGSNSTDHILELVDFSGTEDELSKEMDQVVYHFGVPKISRASVLKACLDYYQEPGRTLEDVCITESLDWNMFWFLLRVLRTMLNLDTFYRDEEQKLNGQIFKLRHPFRLNKIAVFQMENFDNLDGLLINTEPPHCWESAAAPSEEYVNYNEDEKASAYLLDGQQHYQMSDSLSPVDLYTDVPLYQEQSSSGINSGLYPGEQVSYVYESNDPTHPYDNMTNLL